MILLFKIFVISLFFEIIIGLKVKTPSIFGRRVSQMDNDLRGALQQSDIIPDVIDSFPLTKIQVRYRSGVDVKLGNELNPMAVREEPSVEWPTQVTDYYTLIMLDPDAPTRRKPSKREIKHWLVINIPGNDITKGQTLAIYRGPTPLKGSGLHRYVFLIYKQEGLITHSENVVNSTTREGRMNFNARVFAKRYNLGEPISANFFVAQYDEYVGLLRAKNRILKTQPQIRADSRISTKRAQLLDWAPRKPKAPKFPQMICISYEKYEEFQKFSETNKTSNDLENTSID